MSTRRIALAALCLLFAYSAVITVLAVTPETQAVCDWSSIHLQIIFDVLKRGGAHVIISRDIWHNPDELRRLVCVCMCAH